MSQRVFRGIFASILITLTASIASAGELTILHINDHHSHLEADSRLTLTLDGQPTRVRSGGLPAIAAKIKQLETNATNLLKLHAGDAISGTAFFARFKGEADAALMNEICFDAFALGNHEFNEGDSGLAHFLDFLKSGSCTTPVLAANIQPEVGVSALTPTSATDYIEPYIVMQLDGMKIGIIGIDIVAKTKNSSNPDATTIFLDEAKTAQKMADELTASGIDHIILLTHYGYENDLELATQIRGVDVIIGGDSHTLLGDFTELGLSSQGPYPTIVKGIEGHPVCVATAWQYSQILGELKISFNEHGAVTTCQGTPHLMLADSFKRKNSEGERVEVEGGDRDAIIAQIDKDPKLSRIEEDVAAAKTLEYFTSQLEDLSTSRIGSATQTLCLARIPGDDRSTLCPPESTAQHGSDISGLVAHAIRAIAKTSDIAIQNGGGVRTDIAKGDITLSDVYQLLPFSNTLIEMEITGQEIKTVLEEALDYTLQPDGSTGAYPYAAGLRWDVDLTKPMGKRFSNLEFKGQADSAWQPLEMTKTYRLVTNSYIAAGRDGYSTFKLVSEEGRAINTFLDDAQSFATYVQNQAEVNKLPASEYSTQSIIK